VVASMGGRVSDNEVAVGHYIIDIPAHVAPGRPARAVEWNQPVRTGRPRGLEAGLAVYGRGMDHSFKVTQLAMGGGLGAHTALGDPATGWTGDDAGPIVIRSSCESRGCVLHIRAHRGGPTA
jgi:hypothetical protein